MVNYNAGSLLAECIYSVLHQVDEVVVVDNASEDSSISNCEHRFVDEPRLKIIRNDQNLGFAVACNIGCSEAKGDLILFLNPDCCVADDAISQLVSTLESNDDIGMVGGLLTNPDGTEQAGGRRAVPTPWRSFVRILGLGRFSKRWPKLFSDFYLHRQPLPDSPVEVEAISGACMLVKREALEDVGLWDEGYFLHCEDLDLCMCFRQKGWKILFVPSARVMHVLCSCSRSRPIFVEFHKAKGMVRFYKKFFRHQYPGALMIVVIFGVWLRFGLLTTVLTLKRVAQLVGVGRG